MKLFAQYSLLGLLGASSIYAIPLNEKVDLVGQLRTRTEFNQKNTSQEISNGVSYTEMRTRLGVAIQAQEGLNFRIELQDSRLAGGEKPAVGVAPHTATLSDDQGVDLHQAFAQFQTGALTTKIGRQKFKLGSQRLLSSLEWHPNARVFDGLSEKVVLGNNTVQAWAFWIHNANQMGNSKPENGPIQNGQDDDIIIAGIHDAIKISESLELEAYAMLDKSDVGGMGTQEWELFYLGQRVQAQFGKFSFEEEAILQLGEITINDQNLNSLAWQTALRVGFAPIKGTKITLGHDVMSGDLDSGDDTFNTYMNNYSFAHAYYGWMDYVLVNKANTSNEGIQDTRLDLTQSIGKGVLKLAYHHFRSAANAENVYGNEINLEYHLKVIPQSNFVLGAATFIAGDQSSQIGQSGENNGYYFYFMPIFNF